jgi:hypothetical protein
MGQRAAGGINASGSCQSCDESPVAQQKLGLRRLPGYRRLNSSISAPFPPLLA